MKRMTAFILPSLLFLNATGAGQDKKADKQIQGTWTVISLKDSDREEKAETCTITKDTITISRGDRKESVKYKVDPSQKPKWITFTTKGDKTLRGIYELEGDTLRICFNDHNDGKRADRFVSERGSVNAVLIVMQRKK